MSSICSRSCETCNMQLHCQGCSFCEMPFCKKDCHQCTSLCPCRGGSFGYLKSLGGGEVLLKANSSHDLPEFIPVIKDRLTEDIDVGDVIGIHSTTFFIPNGERINKRFINKGLAEALSLPKGTKGVLEFYVKDRTLEGFWDNRKEIYYELKMMDWKVVIAPNFSVYEDAPRIDHLYSMKRSSIVYNEMIEQGIPAVPDITWYNQIDLDQWIREINKNELKTISYSFQVTDIRLKNSTWWRHYLMGFRYMCQRIPEDVQIIIAGIVSPTRLQAIKRAAKGRKLSVLNQTAYLQSRRGILSETGYKADVSLSKNDIFIKNLKYYKQAYSKLNGKDEKTWEETGAAEIQ